MSAKDPAIVYLSYSNGKLVLSDANGKNPSSSCDYETDVKPNGKIGWQLLNDSVSSIDGIVIKSGADIFKKIPTGNATAWEGKIDKKTTGEASYDIVYTPKGGSKQTFDPTLKIKPDTN